jgi:hypothetical protein
MMGSKDLFSMVMWIMGVSNKKSSREKVEENAVQCKADQTCMTICAREKNPPSRPKTNTSKSREYNKIAKGK